MTTNSTITENWDEERVSWVDPSETEEEKQARAEASREQQAWKPWLDSRAPYKVGETRMSWCEQQALIETIQVYRKVEKDGLEERHTKAKYTSRKLSNAPINPGQKWSL